MVHSTVLVKGTRCSSGRRQLLTPNPASATDAPISFKKLRRLHSSPFSCAALKGNSRSSHSRNSGVSASSSVRSEERRVGKECRDRWSRGHGKESWKDAI